MSQENLRNFHLTTLWSKNKSKPQYCTCKTPKHNNNENEIPESTEFDYKSIQKKFLCQYTD